MDRILVEVYVPAVKCSYDMFIPLCSPMYEVQELIKKVVCELTDGEFFADENTTLCYRENGTIININALVYELDIQNGSKLMLI